MTKPWLEMMNALARSSRWAAAEAPVNLIQTHISVLLLGQHQVLKLKKPVDFGFLDYTTIEKRRAACEAEVRLNRRLCPDIYLGVEPVILVDGQPELLEGEPVDYAVMMKRLPDDRMLDRMVTKGEVTEAVLDRVAERLSTFHSEARRGADVDEFGRVAVIRANCEENFIQTEPYIGRTLSKQAFDSIRNWTLEWLENSRPLLEGRVRDRRICEGHGDVRCESICVTDSICIFDCIEFNERFRCGDVASEAAFLAMDLDARGRSDLGYFFSERYSERGGDRNIFELLPFYRCYRAYVRGKVLSFRLDEPEFSEEDRQSAARRAGAYFELARRYSARLASPAVIAVSGLSGSGKTALARAIAAELGLRVISADAVRKAIFNWDKHDVAYGEGPYSKDANRITYEHLVEAGRAEVEKGNAIILDATFRRETDRKLAREMAARAGAGWRLVECRLSPEQTRTRLEKRERLKESLSDATWDTYQRQREEFEPVEQRSDASYLAIDTGGELSNVGRAVTDWLRRQDT